LAAEGHELHDFGNDVYNAYDDYPIERSSRHVGSTLDDFLRGEDAARAIGRNLRISWSERHSQDGNPIGYINSAVMPYGSRGVSRFEIGAGARMRH
jgi:hypothetical protein